ncbi:hypothetical protein IE53DRAFT_310526 [Violaceomyces palustris]|uniref:Uncharacterized protein n=1 Tax=Violaceomyces palustris TaxID=1673888 RepID=A0ACD0P5F5_9BASI|nr:hypothetical protein IE53DRAFT_310526 [Violaceomyces palustris]
MNAPEGLPVPEQDKACFHLLGHPLPALIELDSTCGSKVDLFMLSLSRPVMIFAYPKTGRPGQQVPTGWDLIPGARGCTPHLCSVRDSIQPLLAAEPDLVIYGLSLQDTEYQREAVRRLELPFHILSDSKLELTTALELPTFEVQGETFLKRFTLLLRGGQITRVDYPIFPPHKAAESALGLLVPEEELARIVDERDAAEAARLNGSA